VRSIFLWYAYNLLTLHICNSYYCHSHRCVHIRVLRICIVIVARIYIYNILRIITCGDVHVIYNLPKATQFISVNRKHRAAQLRVHGAVRMVSVDFVAELFWGDFIYMEQGSSQQSICCASQQTQQCGM